MPARPFAAGLGPACAHCSVGATVCTLPLEAGEGPLCAHPPLARSSMKYTTCI